MDNEEYTICKQCIEKGIDNCDYHHNIAITNNKNEILINELKAVNRTLPSIFEEIYLMESASSNCSENYHMTGKIEFWCHSNSYILFNGVYYPLQEYISSDEIVSHTFKIFIDMIRHHPTTLKIWKHDGMVLEDGKPYTEVELIEPMDSLHVESISDYNEIVELAQNRLKTFIETLT